MNATELKNLQAPLKEKYREDPLSAFITLKAQGDINEGISCSIETRLQTDKKVAVTKPYHYSFTSIKE